MEPENKPKPFSHQLFNFYFTNRWYSYLAISYLASFLFFTVFYFDNVVLALKFILYTTSISTTLIELTYLMWGALFVITLIIPFSANLYAIVTLYDIWHKDNWQRDQKVLATFLTILAIIAIIVITDSVIRIIASQEVLRPFIEINQLVDRL
ncbi:hypothetical protein ACFLY7_01485 [Patescibacteria group bacterium]